MGGCSGKDNNREIKTSIDSLVCQKGVISFKIGKEQERPASIQGVEIIILEPSFTIYRKIGQCHPGREVSINLWALADEKKVILPLNQKIEFRISFEFQKYTSLPTDVSSLIFSPNNAMETILRKSQSSAKQYKLQIFKQLQNYSNQHVKFYKQKEAYLNIIVLGSRGVGKSSFILELSKLLKEKPDKPQIGNHASFEMSTTTTNEQYFILQNSNLKVSLIDTPGESMLNLNKKALETMFLTCNECSQTIHTAIVLMDPNLIESLRVGHEIIKVLAQSQLEYVVGFTRWEKLSPIYEDYYVNKTSQSIQKTMKAEIQFLPMEQRVFPISNLKVAEKNVFAEIILMETFKAALELGGNFYSFHQALHVLFEEKIIFIGNRISNKLNFQQFISLTHLAYLVHQAKNIQLGDVFVERIFGKKGIKGLIKIQKELESQKKRNLSDYTQITEEGFRVIKLFEKPGFMANVINQ